MTQQIDADAHASPGAATGPRGPLQFGIPSLDELFQRGGNRLQPDTWPHEPWTLAIVGPDGVGKSLLSLHLASTYAAARTGATVLYVSTDLSWYQANASFEDFGLKQPVNRLTTLSNVYPTRKTNKIDTSDPSVEVEIEHLQLHAVGAAPDEGDGKWRQLLARSPQGHSVGFIDLQATTSGDDWGFVSKLLGLLANPHEKDKPPCNLLIIDAVEGMEMFVGERDQFGERRSRRSRVAQLVRMARATNTHLALVVEEPRIGMRLPEQFVADAVIRLRQRSERGYSLRTAEVEKCRGCKHVRGEHMLVIRSGAPVHLNAKPDDDWLDEPKVAFPGNPHKPLPHVVVIPSLHYWHGQQARNGHTDKAKGGTCPGFGTQLHELNSLLGRAVAEASNAGSKRSLTLLLGESGTHKSLLAQYFLAEALRKSSKSKRNAAILLTTSQIGQEQLRTTLRRLSGVGKDVLQDNKNVWCRRLDPRFMSSGEFVRMLQRYVEEALKQVKDPNDANGSGEVYLVIDDWSLFLSSHPGIAKDRRFAPAVLDYLKQQPVHAMIVATQPVKPDVPVGRPGQDLRGLDELQILTWRVSFFGQQRVAITAITPSSGGTTPTIYELCSASCQSGEPCYFKTDAGHCKEIGNGGDILGIDCDFALYDGLERGEARRVPLEIRLFGGYSDPSGKRPTTGKFHQYLDHKTRDLFFGLSRDSGVVRYEAFESYDHLFHFASSLDTTRLEQTLVLQVDEFWFAEEKTKSCLMDLGSYWTDSLKNPTREREREEFPENLLRKDESFQRKTIFGDTKSADDVAVYRIPYLRDFGFLLANRSDWVACKDITLSATDGPAGEVRTVGDIWNSLCCIRRLAIPPILNEEDAPPMPRPASWLEFFEAAEIVGQASQHLVFDVDPTVSQTLLSLVLEIWFSTLYGTEKGRKKLEAVIGGDGKEQATSLRRLLATDQGDPDKDVERAMFAVLLQIAAACKHLQSHDREITRCTEQPLVPVASREWYSTASLQMQSGQRDLLPLRLPGHFSVCGDWYLAVAAGSRSEPLAHAALDLLSSREMSLLRVQDGIGLPVRRHTSKDATEKQIRTSLKVRTGERRDGPMELLYLEDLDKIAPTLSPGDQEERRLYPLRRSALRGYGRDFFHLQRHVGLFLEEREKYIPASCRKPGNWSEIRQFCTDPNYRGPLKDAFDKYTENIDWILDVLTAERP